MINTEKEITKTLSPHGFRRKRTYWYKEFSEVIPYLHLQKAYHGGSAFLNVCALFPELDPEKLRKWGSPHLFCRLTIEHTGALRKSSSISDEERISILKEELETLAIPLLNGMTDKISTRNLLYRGFVQLYPLVTVEAQKLLDYSPVKRNSQRDISSRQ